MSEQRRLDAVAGVSPRRVGIPPGLQNITELAADLFDAPMAVVTLVDADCQWLIAPHGLDASSTPREQSFCAHLIPLGAESQLVVEDATQDVRFRDNPVVTGAPHVRFYAGTALSNSDGDVLGALCVIDTKPRGAPSARLMRQLKQLAAAAESHLSLARVFRIDSEQKRLLEMAGKMTGAGHWRLDLATGKVRWSDQVYAIHGVSPDTFDPNVEDAIAFYVPEDRPKVQDFLDAVVQSRDDLEFQLRLVRADGEMRHVVSRGRCERDEAGGPIAVFGVFQDVSDHVQAIEEVHRRGELYQLIANNSTDLINRSNLDSDILYVSPAIETLTGYKPSELDGKKTYDLIHPEDWPRVRREYVKLVHFGRNARITPIRYRMRRKDGSWFWVEVSPKLVWEGDTPVEFVDVVRDISERKAFELDLVEARRAAEAAAEAKAEFLANMSHELRTPLTSIVGFSRLLLEQSGLSPAATHFAEQIDAASAVLLSTVNDILDFSKLEAGQIKISRAPVDIRECCESTLELLAPQASAKDLSLDLVVGPSVPAWVSMDADRVCKLILNLLGNAVKFTQSGSVTLSVDYDSQRQALTLAVSDTGPGIAEGDLPLLFKRFSQVDGTLAKSRSGTGLGLAICKGLAEAMSGTVGVSSTLGRGSRFWCEIPAEMVTLPPAPKQEVLGSASVRGLRVLVVEDHPVNRELASIVLAAAGCEVTEARDGREALEAAAQVPFDIFLLDLQLPDMDGRTALSSLRVGGPNENVPVLAFTADGVLEGEDLRAMGFDGVIRKPIHPGQLVEALVLHTTGRNDAYTI